MCRTIKLSRPTPYLDWVLFAFASISAALPPTPEVDWVWPARCSFDPKLTKRKKRESCVRMWALRSWLAAMCPDKFSRRSPC